MSNWLEIRNLANELKKVQSAESTNYLSDRTCVDIITSLINSGRIQLIRTTSGRSFLTSNELNKEIFEELESHRGHVTLLEISTDIDVEYSIVESRVHEIVSSTSQEFCDETFLLVGGDLMTKSFVKRIAEEIRDRLEVRGFMTSMELTRLYSFPPQFLLNVINDFDGVLFKVHKEDNKFYTDSFIAKRKARVLGYFSGVVTPISISSCSVKLDILPKHLSSLIDALISSNKLRGALTNGRSVYTPLCYSRAQDTYVMEFFKQNSYIEWDVVLRVGISDPAAYLRSHFPSALHTKHFTISKSVMSQLEAVLADGLSDGQWIDVQSYLPQIFGPQEREWLIKPLLKNSEFVAIQEYKYLYPKNTLTGHIACFDDYIREQAIAVASDQKMNVSLIATGSSAASVTEGPIKLNEKKGKSGGFGGRAREFKSKSVKKKYLQKSQDSDSETELSSVCKYKSYLPRESLFSILSSHIGRNPPEELIDGILDQLLPELYEQLSSLSKSVLLQTSDISKNRHRFLAEKESLVSTITSLQLLERGALAVDDANLRGQLLRQLLRSDVSILINRLCLFLAQNYDVDWPSIDTSGCTISATKGKKAIRSLRHKEENVSQHQRGDITPIDMTPQQRDNLVIRLANLGGTPAIEASNLLQHINTCLRANPAELDINDGKLPLDEVLSLCDDLASNHLGINLSVSVLRTGASKRKRQDRTLALSLAGQTEQSLIAAAQADDEDALANVTLAGAGLFGHCLAGWPLPVHGKLVPKLCAWICARLSNSTGTSAGYQAAVKEMRHVNAGEKLTALKDLVLQKAKDTKESTMVSPEEEKRLVSEILVTASRVRQAMQCSVAPS